MERFNLATGMNKWMVDPPYLFANEETETRLHAVVVAMRRCYLFGETQLSRALEDLLWALTPGVFVLPVGILFVATHNFKDRIALKTRSSKLILCQGTY